MADGDSESLTDAVLQDPEVQAAIQRVKAKQVGSVGLIPGGRVYWIDPHFVAEALAIGSLIKVWAGAQWVNGRVTHLAAGGCIVNLQGVPVYARFSDVETNLTPETLAGLGLANGS